MARLFKVKNGSLEAVQHRSLDEGGMKEGEFERLVLTQPDLFGEPLVFIGQQEDFPDIGGDEIDIVALDREGAVVVIELKRGMTPSDTDFQVLKYAGFIRTLTVEDLSKRAAAFLLRAANADYRKELEDETGVDIGPDAELSAIFAGKFGDTDVEDIEDRINRRQRIFIVAESFDKRITAAILWLRSVGADVRGFEYHHFPDDEDGHFVFNQLIPIPELGAELAELTKKRGERPWLRDGRAWHTDPNAVYAPNVALVAALERAVSDLANVQILWEQGLYVKVMGPQGRELRVYTSQKKGRLALLFMHASRAAVEELLGSNGVTLGIKENFPYDKKAPWVAVEKPEDFGDQLKSALGLWLLHSE